MAFLAEASKDVNWEKLEFKIRQVNGHIESRYNVSDGSWSEAEFVRDPYLKIHGLAPALNYGQECYEGLKAYRSPSGNINIFRPSSHAARLAHSATYVSIPAPPSSHFLHCVEAAVSLNAEFVPPHHIDACLYIRPVLFGSSAHLGLTPPNEYIFCVYVQPVAAYHGSDPLNCLIMEDFDRAAPKGTGGAKVGGNYAPVIRWSDQAKKEGFGITLHLDSKTETDIEEFSTSGFVGVRSDGNLVTLIVPDSKNVVQSITSDSCLRIAKSFGWGVEVRKIKYSELGGFTEVLAVGTAASIVPIRSISRKSTNDKFSYSELDKNEAGPVFVKLFTTLKDIQQGKMEDKFGWLESISMVKNIKHRDDKGNE
ncbi:aminotransferase [Bisporella sp. PMI_857]|nr:aminotransferase [Bisporella sp. PMI_857]